MVSGRLDVYTFEVDKTMNGIFIVANEQTGLMYFDTHTHKKKTKLHH